MMTGMAAVALFSCGDKATDTGGTSQLDLTVVGKWEGELPSYPGVMNGVKIFATITGADSTFALITRDPTKDTMQNVSIKDTTLVLTGTWRLNALKDSILLICGSCRIIDTLQNILVARSVEGQIVPIFINIYKEQTSGAIDWEIVLTDFIPLAPLLGINLSGIPVALLQGISIVLVKKSQE